MNSPTNEKSLFIISVVLYQDYRRRYPVFKAHEYVCGYSYTLEGAENMMHDELSKDHTEPVYCFYIREKSMEKNFHNCFGEGRLSERVYDAEGVLLDKRLISWEDAYIGRDPETIRFDCGDIVEAYFPSQNQVILGFVMETPPTKAELRPWIGTDTRDVSEDSYMFMKDDKGTHVHQDALYIFKPHFPIPKPTLERLKRQYRHYLEQYAYRFFHKPLKDEERAWLKAHNMDVDQYCG